MERNWSEAALAVFDAYPWRCEAEKAQARAESEMVSFGDAVEFEDLPLKVRQWHRRDAMCSPSVWRWNGESLDELTRAFETTVLTQALEANGGNVSAAARALGTTPRIVDYKLRRLGLTKLALNKKKNKKEKELTNGHIRPDETGHADALRSEEAAGRDRETPG